MKYSRDTLQRIRDATDLLEIVSSYTQLERRGDRWWGLSPFKTEKTPSFAVQPEKGLYYCFATHQGGDVFRFIGEMEGLTFTESVRYLAERAGISIDADSQRDDPEERHRRALRELYSRVTGTFSYLLTHNDRGAHAREYLASRAITDSSIEEFRLGYVPEEAEWLYRFLKSKSYSDEFLAASGLFSRRYPRASIFRNRVIFPITDERGNGIAFGGRALDTESRAKYINSPDTAIYNKKQALYALSNARQEMRATKRAVIAEGYFDVIALHQAGVTNAVAPLGTALTREQAKLLTRWVDHVTLLFDADSAGVEASFRAAAILESVGLTVSAVRTEEGTDAAEIYATEGAEALAARVAEQTTAFTFLLDRAVETIGTDAAENRELILRKVLPYIKVVNSEIRRQMMLLDVADKVDPQLDVSAVMNDFDKWRGGELPDTGETRSTRPIQIHGNRDITLMLATAQAGELFAYLRSSIGADEIADGTARRLYLAMEDAYRHNETLPQGLIDRIDDEQLRAFALDRIGSGEFASWSRADIDRAVIHMRIASIAREQHAIESALRTVTDERERHELLGRKTALDRELADLKVRVHDRVAE
jgi:DNA primase